MRVARPLFVVALLPLFSGCFMFGCRLYDPPERIQGEITQVDGQLLFRACGEGHRLVITGDREPEPFQEIATQVKTPGVLFADLDGYIRASETGGIDDSLDLTAINRLEHSQEACRIPISSRWDVHASGHNPEWNLHITKDRMLLQSRGGESLDLSYSNDWTKGGHEYNAETNGQKVQLLITTDRCVDGTTGGIYNSTAQLRLGEEVLQGCAYRGYFY